MPFVFERFTDRARRVVVLAQEEARLLSHNYIGTEHLLLGLIHEGEGVAAQVLEAMEIDLEAARARVEEIIGEGGHSPSGHIPFTPRAKKVLELALREALQLGHNYIGTEHILLGLVREGEGVGTQVLVEMGAELTRVRRQVMGIIGSRGSESLEGEPSDFTATSSQTLVIESLGEEVRRLRREVDRLRDALRRMETEPASTQPMAFPGFDEPEVALEGVSATPSEVPPPISTAFQSVLQCSFCSEPQDRVGKLIAGPGVYICDRCIALCQEILDEQPTPPAAGSSPDDPPNDS